MIPYGRQHITDEDIAAVAAVLRSDYLTQGPAIAAFESAFAKYVGAEHAVACSNGTAALHLCTMALGVESGQKVITTPITFAASANCVRYCGAEVVFADIDPETALLDLNGVRDLLEREPAGTFSGIIPVDFAGHAVNFESFRKLADEHDCWIIEDACHAPGGFFTDSVGTQQRCGNGAYADLAIFSFHPVKHIACGEGGMVTTNNAELADAMRLLRTHGITKNPERLQENHGGWYYEMQELGYNYRLSDMQAALGLSQLKRAEDGILRRREIADRYRAAFQGTPVGFLQPPEDQGHAYHLFVVQVDDRLGLYKHLRAHNVFAQVHYIPVHTMPYYDQADRDLPHALHYYERCLSLPMYPTLTDAEQDQVIEWVMGFCG